LVVLGGVEDEFSEEFAGGGVDDSDLEVLDQGQDVGSADADVVEPSVDSEGDDPDVVDPVVADPVVDIAGSVGARRGFRVPLGDAQPA
jgi:hypothetical protein